MAVELVDALLRQQVYYEMWKEWEGKTAEHKVEAVIAIIIGLLASYPKNSFAEMSRTEMLTLTGFVIKKAQIQLGKATTEITALVNDALVTVTKVTLDNYNAAQGTERKRVGGTVSTRKAQVMNEPAAGTGLTPVEMLGDFTKGFLARTRYLIQRAYAEKWTFAQLQAAIKGTAAKGYKDGMLRLLRNQLKTIVKTLMQHIQAWVDYNIGKLFYKLYQWISILDLATTDICRSRHRNVYVYGQGPIPPAHYNCRSRIMGVAADASNRIPSDFLSWLMRQPDAFLQDALLPDDYRKVKSGVATRKDFPGHVNTKSANKTTFQKRATVSEN